MPNYEDKKLQVLYLVSLEGAAYLFFSRSVVPKLYRNTADRSVLNGLPTTFLDTATLPLSRPTRGSTPRRDLESENGMLRLCDFLLWIMLPPHLAFARWHDRKTSASQCVADVCKIYSTGEYLKARAGISGWLFRDNPADIFEQNE